MPRHTLTLRPATDPDAYDALVRSLPISSALQGWGYGEARRELGQTPLRFFITAQGREVGALQLLRKPLLAGSSLLYAPRGPALASMEHLPALAPALRQVAGRGDLLVKIEPPLPRSEHLIPEALGPWHRAEAEQPEHTLMVNVSLPESQLLRELHSMARRNVKTAAKRGVTVGRDDDFEAFWEIFTATNARASLGAFPRAYYERMLAEGTRHGGEAYLVLARHEGRALAGGFFLGMGETTNYLFGGSIKDDRPGPDGEPRQDVRAPTAFYWGAILDAREKGYRSLDLWGIPRKLDGSKHSHGVYRMKENFGGEKLWFPAYTVALSPLAPLVTRALRLRKTMNNRRRRGSAEDVL